MHRSKKKKTTLVVPSHDPVKSKAQVTPTTNENTENDGRMAIHSHQFQSSTRILFGVVAVSLLSIPICYILSYLKQMKDSLNVFLYSVVICVSVAPLTHFC